MNARGGSRRTVAATAAMGLALVAAPSASGGMVLVTGEGDEGRVAAFATGPDGAPVPGVSLASYRPASGQRVAVAPDGTHGYVSGELGFPVRRFTIGPGPRLSVVGDPFAVPGGSVLEPAQAYAPDGRFAFSANWEQGTVTSLRLGDDGSVTPINTVRRSIPSALAVSPDGRFLFVSMERGPDDQPLTTFAIGDDGRLSETGHELRAPGADDLRVSPDGRFLYGVSSYGQLNAYAVADDGAVRLLASVSPGPHGIPDALAISPDGRYVYAADSLAVFTFRVGDDGIPTLVGQAKALTQNGDNSVAISPDGRSLYFTDWSSARLFTYGVGADGLPTTRRPAVATQITRTASQGAIAVVPDQAPVASFVADAAPAGAPTTFDASASHDPDGVVARYDWDFGDGTRADDGGPTPRHAYAAPGEHEVRLTVTDAAGTSTTRVFTGVQVLRNGGPSAATARTVVVPPAPAAPPAGPSTSGPQGPFGPPPGLEAARRAGASAGTTPSPARVREVRLTRRYLRLTATGPARLRVTLERRSTGPGGAVRHRRAATLRVTVDRAGRVARRLPRVLPRGAYRVRVTVAAQDGATGRAIEMVRRAW